MTEEVNDDIEIEITTEVPLKYYRLEFEYSDPTSGSVLVAAPDADRAIEIAFESIPDNITDFRITGHEEITREAVAELAMARENSPTLH